MNESPALCRPTPPVVAGLGVAATAGPVVLLVMSLLFPDLGNVEDKAAGLRAVAYPMLAFTVPVVLRLPTVNRARSITRTGRSSRCQDTLTRPWIRAVGGLGGRAWSRHPVGPVRCLTRNGLSGLFRS